MKALALLISMLFLVPERVIAQPGWRYYPPTRYHQSRWQRPVYRPYPVYRQPTQVSTGTAVAGAIAAGAVAGIIGYQLGKNSEKARTQPANCKTVNIDNDQKLVCRDANGNWNVQ